jgi:DNA invertase Pin-like site-specific DNA recombinase
MKIGYARVSTGEQSLDLQVDSLNKAGCKRIFTDELTGSTKDRPGVKEALKYLREKDTLVVWKLDRLGRSLTDLVRQVNQLKKKGIEFESLHENIDTSSPAGKFQFHIFSALAEFERDIILERTMAGLRSARARGRKGGRPKKMGPDQIAMAAKLIKNNDTPIQQICDLLGIGRTTLYRYVSPKGKIRNKVR